MKKKIYRRANVSGKRTHLEVIVFSSYAAEVPRDGYRDVLATCERDLRSTP